MVTQKNIMIMEIYNLKEVIFGEKDVEKERNTIMRMGNWNVEIGVILLMVDVDK